MIFAACVVASFYWQGLRTANGEHYNFRGYTAAHRSLPFGTQLKVYYNGRSVVVKINDRGPYVHGRSLDLSWGAARALHLDKRGVDTVCYEKVTT